MSWRKYFENAIERQIRFSIIYVFTFDFKTFLSIAINMQFLKTNSYQLNDKSIKKEIKT